MPRIALPIQRMGLLVGLCGVALLGCEQDGVAPDPCTGPAVATTPSQVSFTVGDTVLLDVVLVGPPECRPITLTRRSLRFRTDDSLIARVSPNKGYIVGKGEGTTRISVYYPLDGSVWSEIPVTVVP